MQRIILAMAFLCGFFIAPASAHHRHHNYRHHVRAAPAVQEPSFGFNLFGGFGTYTPKHERKHQSRLNWSERERDTRMLGIVPRDVARPPVHQMRYTGDTRIVSHPAGCPGRAFCGCGAANYLGLHDRSLWLARAWFRYPPAAPASRMVGVRAHHVLVLIAQVQGSVWQAYDANSGGHATRIHNVDISRYSIRNPRA